MAGWDEHLYYFVKSSGLGVREGRSKEFPFSGDDGALDEGWVVKRTEGFDDSLIR